MSQLEATLRIAAGAALSLFLVEAAVPRDGRGVALRLAAFVSALAAAVFIGRTPSTVTLARAALALPLAVAALAGRRPLGVVAASVAIAGAGLGGERLALGVSLYAAGTAALDLRIASRAVAWAARRRATFAALAVGGLIIIDATFALVPLALLLTASVRRHARRAPGRLRARRAALALAGAATCLGVNGGFAPALALAAAVVALPKLTRLARRLDCVLGAAIAALVAQALASTGSLAGAVAGAPVLLFAVARAIAGPRAPKVAARVIATFVAVHFTANAALRVKGPDASLVSGGTAPLVANAPPGLLDEGPAAREDYRWHSFTPRRPDGTFRIALLGGSTAWGHAQPHRAESLTGRLEARLAARVAHPEVVCLAFPGGTSDNELGEVVAATTLGWDVDLFLAIDDYNDLTYLSGPDEYPGSVYFWPQHRVGLASPVWRIALDRARWLRPLVARTVVLPHWGDERLAPGAANGFWLDGLVANEESIAVLASASRARFAWASAPLVFDRRVLGPGEEDGAKNRRPEPLRSEIARRSEEVRARVGPAVARRGATVLDLASRIAARSARATDETWFIDECHYTDRGMDVLAEETIAALVAAGALP